MIALLNMKNKNNSTTLVYSTDPKDQIVLNPVKPAAEAVQSRNFVAIFRLEKNSRGGKTVTVIDGLPKNEIWLKELTKELKVKCGVGGTYLMTGKDGLIEIQGDKRDAIKKIFEQKQIKFKGM